MSGIEYPKEILEKYNLGFMYKKCSLKAIVISGLLQTPEFLDAIVESIKNNITINDRLIFNVVEKLYKEYRENRYDKNFKEQYIASNGVEAWKEYVKFYHLIANGFHNVEKLKGKK